MINRIISFSLNNRIPVLLCATVLTVWGWFSMQENPIDAIPDVSENQVIVFSEWMGRSPQLIEDQVTYPLVSNLQGIDGVKNVRGTSMFGMSFVFLIFHDNIDIYYARTRVAERLNSAQRLLPDGVTASLGPDGTGVGHIYWYTLEGKGYDLGELRALQDWYLKFSLQTVPGVSEVASFGGFQKQYQITIDPNKLIYYNLSIEDIMMAVKDNNSDAGGRKFEMSDQAYIVRGLGYIKSSDDIENIPVSMDLTVPIRIKDVATVQMGGDIRTGIFDDNGNGEAVGGIVVMRYGENADRVIRDIKLKMAEVQKGLPPGISFRSSYDRSVLISESVDSVKKILIEEMIVVSLIVLIFLFHWRSTFVILIQLPVSIAISFILLQQFHISSNIMSLTGIALAIGVIVDAGIVMVENAHRRLSGSEKSDRRTIIERSAHQVGRPIFFSTVIIIVSFLPVFLLTGQEYKLFSPLAFTKTFVLLGSALLAITLVPVLMDIFMRGKFREENKNPVSNIFNRIYLPVLRFSLNYTKLILGVNFLALLVAVPMFIKSGSEFMPPLDEGSILFMPVTLPDVSNSEVKRILQVQDKIIAAVPEVENVLGKAGRASTATDNSPISMIETIIMLKPKSEWRQGITKEDIINDLNAKLQIPGVVNGFTQPIINRINMLSTGVRTDVGLKVYGQNLDSINALATKMKNALQGIGGIKDLYVEPIVGGKYLDIEIRKDMIGRYGLSVEDVNMFVETALGGMNLTTTVEGRQRFTVNARFAQDYRSNIEAIGRLPIKTESAGPIPLSLVADVKISEGPPMINSENAMLRGTVLFNVRDRDLGSTVKEAQKKLNELFKTLPSGYSLEWSGQWENKIRADQSMKIIIPLVLIIIFILLVFIYKSTKEALITSMSVPFALVGGIYLVYFYGVNFSVAVAVGFIALLGVAVETGVLMVIYLDEAIARMKHQKGSDQITGSDLRQAVIEGSAKRLRPKLMTVSTALFGLIPILFSHGAGSDVMVPIALPMIGGMITSTIHVLLVTPIIFHMTKQNELKKYGTVKTLDLNH